MSEVTRRRAAVSEPVASRQTVLVVGTNVVATVPLPDSGSVVIGRGQGCDLVVDEPSISRRHAVLQVGPPMTIEDLGSANGTFLRDARLEPNTPTAIGAGDPVQLGSAMLFVQRIVAPARPHRIWSHDVFEGRIEEECARSERTGAEFAVVRLQLDSGGEPAPIHGVFAEILRGSDVIGTFGTDDYEILLPQTEADDALAITARLVEWLEQLGTTARHRIACWPRDGRDPYSLLACLLGRPERVGPDDPTTDRSRRPRAVTDGGMMQQLHGLLERIAQGHINVLLLGETGVGKEVFAERVHALSRRADRPFLRLNCGAFSETLLESELFGHERGAFTSADKQKPGLLETAQGGTVFLDEVGELPMAIQVKLLRVIEDRKVRRVGGLTSHAIDVRFVAATNRDLEHAVARGTFRQDLYFRLNGCALVIPPLRQRVGEIEGLARHFIAQAAAQGGRKRAPELSTDALDLLRGYAWPGNIRELRNVIERACLLCSTKIEPEHLPVEKLRARLDPELVIPHPPPPLPVPETSPPSRPTVPIAPGPPALKHELRELERARILDALAAYGGNQTRAARALGISRKTLQARLDQFGVVRPRKPPAA